MKITVTQEHIDKGKRKDHKCCPIALALKEAGLRNPSVVPGWATYQDFDWGGKRRTTQHRRLPTVAINFVVKFDKGWGICLPFEFQLS